MKKTIKVYFIIKNLIINIKNFINKKDFMVTNYRYIDYLILLKKAYIIITSYNENIKKSSSS
jgi:hypothetical protein